MITKHSSQHKLRPLIYDYSSGPLKLQQLKLQLFQKANCRLAVQYYLYRIHNLYLRPFEILLPRGYQKTGKFVSSNYQLTTEEYSPGDIIFAFRHNLSQEKRILINLHTAVFSSELNIYHVTSITGSSTISSLETFLKYYKIFAVKRVV